MEKLQYREPNHRHTDPMVTCDQCHEIRRWFPKIDDFTLDNAWIETCDGIFQIRFNRYMPCKTVIIKHKKLYK